MLLKDTFLYMYIMELISETYHTTMLDFLAKLNEQTLDGVFTARLTPSKLSDWNKDANCAPHSIDNTVIQWLKTMLEDDVKFPSDASGHLIYPMENESYPIKKVLCFKEYGDKVGVHYHMRFVTDYKDRKSIADKFKKYWKIPKGTGKGNAAYSVRDCKAKDKTIWKNATYIAKQGECIFHAGYTLQEVEFFCTHAAKYVKMAGKLKWEQIILFNGDHIRQALKAGNFTEVVIKSIIMWHQVKDKDLPALHAFRNLVHNISFALNKKYRKGMINTVQNEYARKNKDSGYACEFHELPDELPDWYNHKVIQDNNLKIKSNLSL